MPFRIFVTDSEYNDNKGLMLAGGITFGMTEDEFFAIIPEDKFEKTEFSSGKKNIAMILINIICMLLVLSLIPTENFT